MVVLVHIHGLVLEEVVQVVLVAMLVLLQVIQDIVMVEMDEKIILELV